MPESRQPQSPDPAAATAVTGADFGASLRQWLVGDHDYAWIVNHHSMRPLHRPIRLVFFTNIMIFAVCSVLLLLSDNGPSGTFARTFICVVLVVQIVVATSMLVLPVPESGRSAYLYFVGFAIFGDLGLTSVLVFYRPLEGAIGCALFALTSALCTYFVSSRWLIAHMMFSTLFIVYSAARVGRAGILDPYSTAAGAIVLLAAVCGVPVAAHVAWTLLSIDARQSLRDPLTGLHNRRGIEASLEPLWRAAQIADTAIAAVVIDIDDFKRVNDTYGHDVGDVVLQQMSAKMLGSSGDTAVAGRTGGEEFTIILTGSVTDIVDRIGALPDRLRDATESAPVTVSVGAAVIESPRDHHADDAIRAALRAADGRMYDAKRSGGGRAFISTI